MNTHRAFKRYALGGAWACAVLTLSGAATSGTRGFGSWTANNGTITGCPSGLTNNYLVTGDGFRQLQMNDNNSSDSFVWMIVTDPTATDGSTTVPFSDENFVNTGGSVAGIADKKSISDSSNSNFTSAVTLLTGFAAPTPGSLPGFPVSTPGNLAQIQRSVAADPDGVENNDGEFAAGFSQTTNQVDRSKLNQLPL